MAEIKVNDLPVMSTTTLTGNDHFIVIDDDKARLMTVADFQSWMKSNVQGAKGDQGVAGRNGTDGTNGTNGTNGKSAYDIAVANGYVGSESDWIKSVQGVKGDTGATGAKGNNGYSPVYQLVTNSNGVFIQITDWTGGDGTKPATGYLSSTGIVSNINNATSIKGAKGDQGLQGVKGDQGIQGTKGDQGIQGYSAYDVATQQGFTGTQQEWLTSLVGKPVSTISVDKDGVVTITDSANNTVVSNKPDRKNGFYVFNDGSYSSTSPLNLLAKTETALNNDTNKKTYSQISSNVFTSPNTLNCVLGSYYRLITEFTCTKDSTFHFKIKKGSDTVFDVLGEYVAGEVHFELDYYIESDGDLTVYISSDVDNSIFDIKQTIVKYI